MREFPSNFPILYWQSWTFEKFKKKDTPIELVFSVDWDTNMFNTDLNTDFPPLKSTGFSTRTRQEY